MAYNSNTGKITPPVSISDIQSAIGNSSGDLATLCKAPTVNMWAKYKPVQLYQVIDTTGQYNFTQNRWKTQTELGGERAWWKGLTTQMGGITAPGSVNNIPGFTSLSACIAAYDGGLNGWVYNQPQIGTLHPFRQTDFAHYNHQAPPAIENFYVPDIIPNQGRLFASALMSMPDENGDYISLIDFKNDSYFANFYFGAAIYNQSDVLQCRATALEDGMAGVIIKLPTLTINQNYKVYPFFCNKVLYINDASDPSGSRFLPCPNLTYKTMYVVDRNYFVDIAVSAAWDLNTSGKINVSILNGDSQAFQHSYIYIMPMQYWNNPGPNVSYNVAHYSDFTLPQSSLPFEYSFTGLTYGEYFVYCTFSNGSYNRKTNILEPYAPH